MGTSCFILSRSTTAQLCLMPSPQPPSPFTGYYVLLWSFGCIGAPNHTGAQLVFPPPQLTTLMRRQDGESPCAADEGLVAWGGGKGQLSSSMDWCAPQLKDPVGAWSLVNGPGSWWEGIRHNCPEMLCAS